MSPLAQGRALPSGGFAERRPSLQRWRLPARSTRCRARRIREWVNALIDSIQERPTRNAHGPESSDSRMSGISVPPGENLVIVFTSSQREGTVSVTLTDERDVVVRGPTHSATFTSGPDRLTVHNENSSASFEIQVPHDAQRIEIRVEDRTIFVKDGADIRAEKSAEGSFSLPLSRSLSPVDSISR